MKSPITGKEMELKLERSTLVFRKEVFEYTQKSYYCEDSGESFTTTELDEFNLNQVYNQYRDKHNIPFTEEIIDFRNKYSFNFIEISTILGLGANSYRNYEKGEVPSLAHSALLKTVINNSEALESLIRFNGEINEPKKEKLLKKIRKVEEEEGKVTRRNMIIHHIFDYNFLPDTFSGYKKPDFDKLVEMIVYFTDKVFGTTPTKMNKLLFYADFLYYKLVGNSISGTRYFAHTHGPVPENFRTLFDYLAKQNVIELESVKFTEQIVGEIFKKSEFKQFNKDLFNETELNVLDEIVEKFKKCNASEIREKSHEESAWLDNQENKDLIDYNYSFSLKHI